MEGTGSATIKHSTAYLCLKIHKVLNICDPRFTTSCPNTIQACTFVSERLALPRMFRAFSSDSVFKNTFIMCTVKVYVEHVKKTTHRTRTGTTGLIFMLSIMMTTCLKSLV